MGGEVDLCLRGNQSREVDLLPRRGTKGRGERQAGGRNPSPAASREKPAPRRLLPMQLQPGDRLTDETGEWEVSGRPYTTAGGKTAHVRVQRLGQPDVTEIRT